MQTRSRLSGWLALAVFATVGGTMVSADPAFAKVDVDKLTVGGEIRERYEVRTNAAMEQGSPVGFKGNESVGSQRVRLNVGYDLTPDVSFFMQIQDTRFFGGEGTAAGTGAAAVSTDNANGNGIDLHQGYIQLKNVLTPGLSLKAGRQEIIFGDHRYFGNFGWSQVGNAFDGVRLTHSMSAADIDLFWARIVDPVAIAGAGGAGSGTNILFPAGTTATQSTANQDIYGLYTTLKVVPNWTFEPYLFLLANHTIPQPTTAATGTAINTAQFSDQVRKFLGGRVNGKVGGFDFTYEGNYQFGSAGDNCSRNSGAAASCGSQAGAAGNAGQITGGSASHINAAAHAVKTGFTFEAVPMKPRIGFEFDYASGDKCSAGPAAGDNNACGSSHNNVTVADQLYPTNHFAYGAMDLQSLKNEVIYRFDFDVKPSPVSKLQFNWLIHRLASTADDWYRANQGVYMASKATNQEASLGSELDVHYWHTFKEKFKFEVGFGHFWAGAYERKSVGNQCVSNNTQGASTMDGSAAACSANGKTLDQNWGYVMGSILF